MADEVHLCEVQGKYIYDKGVSMRGIYTSVIDIRRKVFTEVARLAYEGGDYAKKIEQLPLFLMGSKKVPLHVSITIHR